MIPNIDWLFSNPLRRTLHPVTTATFSAYGKTFSAMADTRLYLGHKALTKAGGALTQLNVYLSPLFF